MSILLSLAAVFSGYLIGAFPSAYVIARLCGNVNLLNQGPSHVSATAVYRELGWKPFIPVIVIDLTKGMLAVFLANILTHSELVVFFTAVAAVAGHCWSVYIKFYGGLGAVIIYGILLYLTPVEFFIGLGVGVVTFLVIKKSTLATYLWLFTISIALLIEKEDLIRILLPVALLLIQILKKRLTHEENGTYADNLAADFRKKKKLS